MAYAYATILSISIPDCLRELCVAFNVLKLIADGLLLSLE